MEKELKVVVGKVIAKHRKNKGWSQMKLAAEADMHLNALGNLERGQRAPNLVSVFLLCRALEISVSEVMAEVESENPLVR